MPTPPASFLSRALAAVILLSPLAPAAAQDARKRAAPVAAAGTVVFAVKKYEANVQIEPVVILRGNAYARPPVGESDVTGGSFAAVSKRFIAEHFRPGRQFRLLFFPPVEKEAFVEAALNMKKVHPARGSH